MFVLTTVTSGSEVDMKFFDYPEDLLEYVTEKLSGCPQCSLPFSLDSDGEVEYCSYDFDLLFGVKFRFSNVVMEANSLERNDYSVVKYHNRFNINLFSC